MKSYFIDEIQPSDMKKIDVLLKDAALKSQLETLFWVRMPDIHLTPIQARHEVCNPHVFAVELGIDWVKFEFFIRSSNQMNCECQAYATRDQASFITYFADSMLNTHKIRT